MESLPFRFSSFLPFSAFLFACRQKVFSFLLRFSASAQEEIMLSLFSFLFSDSCLNAFFFFPFRKSEFVPR